MISQVFSILLPLGNYNFKFNQPCCTSVVDVAQLLETAKACISNPNSTCVLYRPSLQFCRLSSRNPAVLRTKTGSSIPVETCFFCAN